MHERKRWPKTKLIELQDSRLLTVRRESSQGIGWVGLVCVSAVRGHHCEAEEGREEGFEDGWEAGTNWQIPMTGKFLYSAV